MTLEEIRICKGDAERRIADILNDLEQETSTRLADITFSHEKGFCNGARPEYITVNLQLRV